MDNVKQLVASNLPRNVLILILISFGLSACKQIFSGEIVRFADKSTYMVDEQAIQTVDRTFYAAFHVGNWHYKGANARFGEVNAYIQIPQRLELDDDVQEEYIKQILCPNEANLDLWHQLKNVDLQLHIYTSNKLKSISATCQNPLKSESTQQA